eukprot:8912227-Karenia_brevis.AAC.1
MSLDTFCLWGTPKSPATRGVPSGRRDTNANHVHCFWKLNNKVLEYHLQGFQEFVIPHHETAQQTQAPKSSQDPPSQLPLELQNCQH